RRRQSRNAADCSVGFKGETVGRPIEGVGIDRAKENGAACWEVPGRDQPSGEGPRFGGRLPDHDPIAWLQERGEIKVVGGEMLHLPGTCSVSRTSAGRAPSRL